MKSNAIICIFTIIIIFYGCDSTNDTTGVYNSNIVSGCTDITACNYDGDATIDDSSCIYDIDVCGKCGGNTILTEDCPIIWNIYYDVSDTLAGFQFDIAGVTVIGVSGGATEEAGLMISFNATTVIGFSLGGNTIPEGSGLFIVLELEGDEASACIINIPTNPLIISDPEGNQINAEIINCNTIKY